LRSIAIDAFALDSKISKVSQRSMSASLTRERRSKVRFPLSVQLQYKLRGSKTPVAGAGQSVNISSVGVFFVAEQELNIGERVEMTLEWPAPLDGVVPLRLCVFGRVVRAEGRRAAVKIDHHEFRTTKRPGTSESSKNQSRFTG
jgi:hypothetical protein